ncbi:MAG TPA: O-antigen ligase family protein [Thermoleophilaceae bacterium]|nr:O-antigen ligase family protein [Thermoleophilaceae bacterium]
MAELGRLSPTMVAAGAFVVTVALAAANGGYSPSAWNWTALLLIWALAVSLVLRERIAFSRLEIATFACLAAFVLWTGLSIAWSDDAPQSVLELQRGFLYLIGLATVLAGIRMRSIPHLLGGLLAGIAAVATYSLLTLPFTAAVEGFDPITSRRLSEPIGYWNALGAFAGIGVPLALGFAAHGRAIVSRAASAATLPILLTAVYLTFSRGAWIALAIGLVAAIALGAKRVRLVTALLALAPASAAAVWISSKSDALTTAGASQEVIAAAGRDLVPIVLLLAAISMGAAVALSIADRRLKFSASVRRAYAAGLAIVALGGLVVVFARFGGPVELAGKAYGSFARGAPQEERLAPGSSLNQRLFTLQSQGRVLGWEAALMQWKLSPTFGSGAGTFEQYWLRTRQAPAQARDAHSLYLEALAELGWIGAALIVATLAVPIAAATQARRQGLVAAAFGAYATFLVHAGVDWDWELPAVALVGLVLGASLLRLASRQGRPRKTLPSRVRIATLPVLIAAFVASALLLVGNRALAAAEAAADAGDSTEAEQHATTATRWLPWAGQAWQQLGRAQLGLGEPVEARESLLEAARKDPSDWRIRYDLGMASGGAERKRAYDEARALNPLAPDVQALRAPASPRESARSPQ